MTIKCFLARMFAPLIFKNRDISNIMKTIYRMKCQTNSSRLLLLFRVDWILALSSHSYVAVYSA